MENIVNLIETYGYVIIVISLFLGVVGIPAPEESLVFLIGLFIGYGHLNLMLSTLLSSASVYVGMLVAYVVGRWLGYPFLQRFGKIIGLTEKKLQVVSTGYQRNALRMIVFSMFIPGIRQLSPYMAGISHIPFKRYTIYAFIATFTWVMPFLLAGRILGTVFHVEPKVAPYIGMGISILFISYFLWSKRKKLRLK